jgi:Asp-tRNA(Asn)/Glu-tRNA(Gln) amidotransferase A subunit family amidase
LRIVVKDVFCMEGLKTSLNNRAYYEFSAPAELTATMIEALACDGAQIVGMTKLSSMIAREEPSDAVEFRSAFNPRGDGYQSPVGSSSGSAAAVAAYEWVDCGIGTDACGNGRQPALANGVWQFRPSHDLVDHKSMVAIYTLFDTPCIF